MKSALSLTLIICLSGWALPVSAQDAFRKTPSPQAGGPLSESVSREAAKLAATSPRQAHASKRMVWTGVAVAGAGVALTEIALHEANVSYCPGSTLRGCDENLNGGLLAAGVAAIVTGSVLTVVGALPIHADVTAGAGAVMITRRVTF
jgi:hypothetical protein